MKEETKYLLKWWYKFLFTLDFDNYMFLPFKILIWGVILLVLAAVLFPSIRGI